MPRFHFRVHDRFKRILAENDIEESDTTSACRSVAVALAFFALGGTAMPGASIELDDETGHPIARISIKVDKL